MCLLDADMGHQAVRDALGALRRSAPVGLQTVVELGIELTSAIWRGKYRHMAKNSPSLSRLTRFLGGRSVLGAAPRSRLDFVDILRKGLPYKALEAVGKHLALSADATAKSLRLSPRTLARRKAAGRLDPVESERVIRLADIAALASEIFGSDEGARSWLEQPNRALGGASPMRLLDTDMGAETVRDVLGRIEHGVFS